MTRSARRGILQTMKFEVIPAYDIPFAEQARLNNKAFAGYVGGWSDLDASTFARFVTAQGADLYFTRFLRNADGLIGFGYITRTGNVSRLSGMALIPAARGTGAADYLLERLFAEAKERGDTVMMLEVIEQNPRAHALYLRHRFRDVDRLLSWRRVAAAPPREQRLAEISEVSVLEALRLPNACEYPDIPWQVSRHALVKAISARAFRAGDACIFVLEPPDAPLRVHGFLSARGHAPDWNLLREILGALIARYPERDIFAAALFPEACGRELFQPLGFDREPISQFLMRKEL